jgi:hypothetical protein
MLDILARRKSTFLIRTPLLITAEVQRFVDGLVVRNMTEFVCFEFVSNLVAGCRWC